MSDSLYGGVHFTSLPDPDNVSLIDHGALPMIADMHKYGVRVDIPFLHSLTTRIETRQIELLSTVHSHIGDYQYRHSKHGLTPFSIGSRDHLSQLLFEELCVQGDVPLMKTPAGKRFEVSEEVLKPFIKNHPVVEPVIEWHSIEKLRNTYTVPLVLHADSDSRIHTTFNPTNAATGRLSSSNPNLQNISVRSKLGKEIRNAFIASPGCVLCSADLSQIEMVWAAHRSQDPSMLETFRLGQDIHIRTACDVFDLNYYAVISLRDRVEAGTATAAEVVEWKEFKQFKRLPCKTVGFGVLYGQTAEGLQSSLASEGIFWTIEQCEDMIENKFFGVRPMLREMLERDYSFVRRYAMICDEFGRVRLVPEAKSVHKRISNEGIRKAGNHPEQASAQATEKIGMARLNPICRSINGSGYRCWPLIQIHDDCVFDVDKRIAEDFVQMAQYEFEHATPLSIPVKSSANIGERWGSI